MARGYNDDKETMSVGQVATACRVCARTVRSWCEKGLISFHLVPGGAGHRRIVRADLVKFMREHQMPEEWIAAVNAKPAATAENN